MYAVRRWSVRHAVGLRAVYAALARIAPPLGRPLLALGERRAERLLAPVEHGVKGLLFDCQMCGQCVLSATGMACPTNCGKRMRNGPCGGVREDESCEVDPAMRCVWVEATEGRHRLNEPRPGRLRPIDHRRGGTSTWVRVLRHEPQEEPAPPPQRAVSVPEHETFAFEQACSSGRPVVTVELGPPDSADPGPLIARAERFSGLADAINITDGAGGNCHMSSAAASAVLAARGIASVCQVTCRDRNRIALQGDILGVAALGVRNLLCLTGDDVSQGDQPQSKPVFDLDSIGLLRVASTMRDKGHFDSGRVLQTPPNLFLGATCNPFAPPFAQRVDNLELKIDSGARFIQTQFCFDVPRLEDFMRRVRERELHRRATIIVGVGTLNTAKALRWMAHHVPGVHIPDALLARIEAAADQKAEGLKILVETIGAVLAIDGISGVHLMGHRNEDILAAAITEAGLGPSTPQGR